MNDAFARCPRAIGTQAGLFGALRSRQPAVLTLLVGIVVFSAVAMATVPVARWLDRSRERVLQLVTPEPSAEAAPSLGLDGSKPGARARCETCGVVQAIRRIEAAGDLPAAFEFTVRLRDGSIRLSRSVNQAKWRAGDSIMLIGGTRPAGQSITH